MYNQHPPRLWSAFVRLLSVALVCFASQLQATAQLPTTSLRTVWPCSVQAGGSYDLSVEGDFLDEADQLVFSDSRITAEVKTSEPLPGTTEPAKQYGQFTVHVPGDIPPGFVDVRVRGRYGLSNPRRLAIEASAVNKIEETRFTLEQAKEIQLNQVQIARATANQIDHYRVNLEAGTQVRIACDALAIDSPLVATVILCDAQQKELSRARGTKAADAILPHLVTSTGTYYLKVHDSLFRGGNAFAYRLRLDVEPKSQVEGLSLDHLSFNKRLAGLPAAQIEQYLTSSDQVRRLNESELLDSASIIVTPPENVLSRFPETGIPVASFDFEAKAGQRWFIEVASAITGAATDPELQIGRLRPQGDNGFSFERLHHIDDVAVLPGSLLGSTGKDPSHLFNVPEYGRYRVILRDLQTTSDKNWNKSFLLSIRPAEPDFELMAMLPHPTLDPARSTPMGSLLRRGDKLAIEVAIIAEEGFFEPVIAQASVAGGELTLRQSIPWVWPVNVTAENLPAGLTCSTLRLDNGNRRGYLIIEAADDLQSWVGPLQIIGSLQLPAELGGQILRRPADAITIQLADPDGRGHGVVRPCDDFQLATTDAETTPLKVTLGGDVREFSVKVGTDVDIPLSLQRSESAESAKGKVTLRVVSLPPNSTAAEVNLEGENLTANMKLTVPANVPLGDYQIFVNAETEVAWPRNPQSLSRAEQRLETLKQQLVAAEEAQKELLTKQVADAETQVNQLRESTKPQAARAFVPSNPIIIHVVPNQ